MMPFQKNPQESYPRYYQAISNDETYQITKEIVEQLCTRLQRTKYAKDRKNIPDETIKHIQKHIPSEIKLSAKEQEKNKRELKKLSKFQKCTYCVNVDIISEQQNERLNMLEITEYFSELRECVKEDILALERGDYNFIDFMYYFNTRPLKHLNAALITGKFEAIDYILNAFNVNTEEEKEVFREVLLKHHLEFEDEYDIIEEPALEFKDFKELVQKIVDSVINKEFTSVKDLLKE